MTIRISKERILFKLSVPDCKKLQSEPALRVTTPLPTPYNLTYVIELREDENIEVFLHDQEIKIFFPQQDFRSWLNDPDERCFEIEGDFAGRNLRIGVERMPSTDMSPRMFSED